MISYTTTGMSAQSLLSSDNLLNGDWYERCEAPTQHITTEQYLWMIKHTMTNAMICFGVNFALVTLSFYGKDDVKLFEFPSTIAGAYALTIFIEVSLNWLSNGILMTLEIKKGKVPPLDPSCVPWWPKERLSESSMLYYSNMTELVLPPSRIDSKYSLSSSSDSSVSCSASCLHALRRFFNSQIRSVPWMIFIALTLLPIFTGVTYALYDMEGYNDFPQPQILVGVFGVLIVFVTMPFWTINTLAVVGYRLLDDK